MNKRTKKWIDVHKVAQGLYDNIHRIDMTDEKNALRQIEDIIKCY